MDTKLEVIKLKDLKSSIKILKELRRKRSLLVSVLIDLLAKGLKEREICLKLGICYKNYRYALSKPETIIIRAQFQRAREYSKTMAHEKTIRKTIMKYK